MIAHYALLHLIRPQSYWTLNAARLRPPGAGDWPIIDGSGCGSQKFCRQGLTVGLLTRYELQLAQDLAR